MLLKKWILIVACYFSLLVVGCSEDSIRFGKDNKDYVFIPQNSTYTLYNDNQDPNPDPVYIWFQTPKEWADTVKKYVPNYPPNEVGGLTLRSQDRKFPQAKVFLILIPFEADGSIDLDSLGHEIAHVLEWKWHG